MKSLIRLAPKVSSSVSVRLGSGFIAPLGRSRSARYMFIGDVNMWRILVTGRMATNTKNAPTCTSHRTWWVVSSDPDPTLRSTQETE